MKKLYIYIIIAQTLIILHPEIMAQDFSTDYFSPKKITNQPKSNNSFFYGSYSYYLNMDFEDVIDIQLDRGKYSSKYSVAWYKNTSLSSRKGFEIMATSDMWTPVVNLSSETGSAEAQFQTLNLKLSTVGKKGSSISVYGRRDMISLQGQEIGLWGWGLELTAGGHPNLTEKKDKWPFSFTFGTSVSFQQRPATYDESRWTTLKEKNNITSGMNTVYATLALQRIAHRKGVGIYFKMEVTGAIHQYGLVAKKVFVMEDNQEMFLRAGAGIGLLF